jgi:hypothetical protein
MRYKGWMLVSLFGAVVGVGGGVAAGSAVERFREVPADCRILKIVHGWPDGSAEQDGWIAGLGGQGFGGVVCNVSHREYLRSPGAWEAFVRAVGAARDAGFALWLYDEKGYPSGLAGGEVLRHDPSWEAEGLLAVERVCEAGPVAMPVPPGVLVLAAAYPLEGGVARVDGGIDLSGRVNDGRLDWDVPAGSWRLLVLTRSRLYEGTHAESNLSAAMPYPNLLRAEPTARFIELTHEQYASRLGPDLGRYFVSAFTDEPSLMSMYLRRMPWRPLPWSSELPAEFARRRGYALEQVLPSLVFDTGPSGFRHRHDYWQTIGELIGENFFGQIREACNRFGIRSGGHLLAEENLSNHVALYGDFFGCLRRMDAPGIDCLTSIPGEVPWQIAKLAAAAADLGGHAVVMSETSDHAQVWRPEGDARPRRTVTEAEIRGTVNRLVAGGINCITSYYSFNGLDDEALNRLNDWTGRICALMRGGRSGGEIAVVYPAGALAAHFFPSHHWAGASPAVNRIDALYRAVLTGLVAARREFAVVDDQALVAATVEDGRLVYNGMRWRVLVLPGVDVLSRAAWEKIEQFVEAGGVVIAVGSRPASDGRDFPAPAIEALGRRLLGAPQDGAALSVHSTGAGAGVFLPAGQELLLDPLLDRWLAPDVVCDPPSDALRGAHRRIDGQDVFLVINDSPQPWNGRLTFAARGPGHSLDPATGRATPGIAPDDAALALGPYAAMGYAFPEPAAPRAASDPSTALPRLAHAPIRVAEPLVSRGEWVRETFRTTTNAMGATLWHAAARLTKADVDTYLFVRFPVVDPDDLSAADAIALRVSVPEDQHPATQFLVIVSETGGGDFLASTTASLAEPGAAEIVVPWSHLQYANWSSDADGLLDRTKIAELRIGWGGYYGADGESITFTTDAPTAVRASIAGLQRVSPPETVEAGKVRVVGVQRGAVFDGELRDLGVGREIACGPEVFETSQHVFDVVFRWFENPGGGLCQPGAHVPGGFGRDHGIAEETGAGGEPDEAEEDHGGKPDGLRTRQAILPPAGRLPMKGRCRIIGV